MKHCVALATLVLISTNAAHSAVEPLPTEELRSAPWWRALRAETYYKQCHSSCTEFSQGTKTTVELCDDTQVHYLLQFPTKDMHFRLKSLESKFLFRFAGDASRRSTNTPRSSAPSGPTTWPRSPSPARAAGSSRSRPSGLGSPAPFSAERTRISGTRQGGSWGRSPITLMASGMRQPIVLKALFFTFPPHKGVTGTRPATTTSVRRTSAFHPSTRSLRR